MRRGSVLSAPKQPRSGGKVSESYAAASMKCDFNIGSSSLTELGGFERSSEMPVSFVIREGIASRCEMLPERRKSRDSTEERENARRSSERTVVFQRAYVDY